MWHSKLGIIGDITISNNTVLFAIFKDKVFPDKKSILYTNVLSILRRLLLSNLLLLINSNISLVSLSKLVSSVSILLAVNWANNPNSLCVNSKSSFWKERSKKRFNTIKKITIKKRLRKRKNWSSWSIYNFSPQDRGLKKLKFF